ncbi:uncharacterized protein LOC131676490 [Topomyia yanbarensis]|uniref:uncharacterized protein LOC131676490 n=1 Tax=Topomyia yanbarensis TaxID=2498891 RepID=UPI00273CA0BF|nr:uncharacterized protein LOC131676490 [Topomyia yanbarensis]
MEMALQMNLEPIFDPTETHHTGDIKRTIKMEFSNDSNYPENRWSRYFEGESSSDSDHSEKKMIACYARNDDMQNIANPHHSLPAVCARSYESVRTKPNPNNARRKRYMWHRRQGLSSKEAWEKSKQPMPAKLQAARKFKRSVNIRRSPPSSWRGKNWNYLKNWELSGMSTEPHRPLTNMFDRNTMHENEREPAEVMNRENATPYPASWRERNWNHSNVFVNPENSQRTGMFDGGNSTHSQIYDHERETNFSAINTDIKIGIIPKNYPEALLGTEEAANIRKVVLQLMVTQRANNNIKPQFTQNTELRLGFMVFHCSDEGTARWLEQQVHWDDLGCYTVRESEIPTGLAVVGHFQDSAEDTTDFILGMIEAQNDLLSSGWRQLDRQNYENLAILTLEVDPCSWQTLERLGFEIVFEFGQKVQLKPTAMEEGGYTWC